MPRRTYTYAFTTIAFALSMIAAMDATAGGQRSFVSGSGVDVGACTVTAPCRTFNYAITQTISGGEVLVLDSAGYGPVTITQSVSIIAPGGVYAGISVPAAGTGVAITGAAVNVVLRGLTINGIGGSFGIRMTNGSELTVEDCVISNFVGPGHVGVSIETAATVKIAGTVTRDSGSGIVVGFGATANIANSQVVNNAFEGIETYGGSSGTTYIVINDTLVTGSSYCIDNFPTPGTTGNISATRVTVSNCFHAIFNEPQVGAIATTTVSNSMVTSNTDGIQNATGTFLSLGNNHVSGNGVDKSGVITTIPPM